MALRSIAILSCVLLAACTTDLDRFKISASGQPNGVTGDAGGAGGSASSRSAGAGGSRTAGRSGGGSDEPIAGGGAGDETPPNPQSDGGPMAGSGGSGGSGGDPCDGMTVYVDGDGDSYGDPTSGRPGCEAEGLVSRAGDCADDDDARNPDAEESCDNEEDDNCNDATNEGCACVNGTSQPCGTPDGAGGFLDRGQCKPGTQACIAGAWSNTCDGATGPKADTCNGLNDDCDLGTDEGVLLHRYTDGDGDLYGSTQLADGCAGESGVAYQGGDCNDGNMLAYPGAPERCGRAGQLGDDCNASTVTHCPTHLPPTPAGCPTLVTGTMTLFGYDFRLWVGARNEDTPAPMVIFFYGTGGSPSQATSFYPKPVELTDQGGIFIAPSESTGAGSLVGSGIWYTGDYPILDQVIGCALAQLNIDVRRIYVSGLSAGGMQAAVMGFQRSGYIAGVLTNSGGLPTAGLGVPQNADETAAVVAMHGAMGTDVVIVDFADLARTYTQKVVLDGGFAVDCNHGGGHALAPALMQQGAWKVLLDHPYGELPPNYSLPSELSTTQCHVVVPP